MQHEVLREQLRPSNELRTVLGQAVQCHPTVAHLKLELVKLIVKEAKVNKTVTKGT